GASGPWSPSEPRDEEARSGVSVGRREEELGPFRVRERRPLVAERLRLEAGRVDDRLVLVRVQRADGVDNRAAGAGALGSGPEQLELEPRQGGRVPAEVGAGGKGAAAPAPRAREGTGET